MNLQAAVVFNEASFRNLFMKKLTLDRHRHGAHPFRDVFASHARRHEERSNREFRASVRRDKYLGVRWHDRGSEDEKYEPEADDQPAHVLRAAQHVDQAISLWASRAPTPTAAPAAILLRS